MNWTGGRLNRHARSNNDRITRTQRQQFARRKQQRIKRITDNPSTQTSPGASRDGGQRALDDGPVGHTGGLSTRSDVFVRPTADPSVVQEDASHVSEGNVRPGTQQDDISAAKLKLLSKPDWLKLSACTSMKLKFPGEHEMSRIGKRRRTAGGPKAYPPEVLDGQPPSVSSPSPQHQAVQIPRPFMRAIDTNVPSPQHPAQFTSSYFPLPSSPPVLQHRNVSLERSALTTQTQIVLNDSERSSYVLHRPHHDDDMSFLPCLTDLRGLDSFDAIRESSDKAEAPPQPNEALLGSGERLYHEQDLIVNKLNAYIGEVDRDDVAAHSTDKNEAQTPRVTSPLKTFHHLSATPNALVTSNLYRNSSASHLRSSLLPPAQPTAPMHFVSDARMRNHVDKQLDSSSLALDLRPGQIGTPQVLPTRKRNYTQAFAQVPAPFPGIMATSSANKTRRPLPSSPHPAHAPASVSATHTQSRRGLKHSDPFASSYTSARYFASSNSMSTPTRQPRFSMPQRPRQDGVFPLTYSRARR